MRIRYCLFQIGFLFLKLLRVLLLSHQPTQMLVLPNSLCRHSCRLRWVHCRCVFRLLLRRTFSQAQILHQSLQLL